MELKYFSFQAWKGIEFNCWSWKIIMVCVVCKLLQMPKLGQKIQASHVRKYLETRMSLTIFDSGS